MYALIYDEFEPAKREKRVISVHKTRETAEKALKKRQRKLGRRVWECHTRIVWVNGRVHEGETITPNFFDTWAPGEKIPQGGSGSGWGLNGIFEAILISCDTACRRSVKNRILLVSIF